MSKIIFTDESIKELAKNPNVQSVSDKPITYAD